MLSIVFFKQLRYIDDSLYEVELVKAQIEHREPIVVGFFILQYAKLRMLELYYNFQKYCDQSKFEEIEMDTDSLFSTSGKLIAFLKCISKSISDCITQEKAEEWSGIRKDDCIDEFEADSSGNFSPGHVLLTPSLINGSQVCSKKSFEVQK